MQIFQTQAHRPYPIKSGPWIAWQEWNHLLFAHWPVNAELLKQHIPASLTLDIFTNQIDDAENKISENSAWIGIIPFSMRICP